MSPHRLTTYRRYKISNDVLILILANLDPPSLWRACKAFRRIYMVVMEFQPLLYIFELAIAGMRDGPAPHLYKPSISRLQLLLSYRKDWPKLHWTHENKTVIPGHARAGISGGFLYQIYVHGSQYVLNLSELPSCRTGRPPALTRHIRYTTPQIEYVAIDRAQSLIITGHAFSGQNSEVGVRLQIRDLWSFNKHSGSPTIIYDFSAGGSTPLSNMAMAICGDKLAISLEFVGGKKKHLLMSWRDVSQARWLDDQDIHFLNKNYLLVVKRSRGLPVLNIYNIAKIDALAVEREYELPEIWNNSIIGFIPNTAPLNDESPSPEALFYPDPSIRVLLITAKTPIMGSAGAQNWLFINESYFRPTSRRDRLRVPWKQWSEYCVIRDLSPNTIIRGPRVISNRVVYTEDKIRSSTRGYVAAGSPYLNIIDFAPYPESANRDDRAWTLVGQRSLLVPNESTRDIPANMSDNYGVEDIGITEDNLVLFSENGGQEKPVNVLTFGVPTRSRR